MRHVYGTCPASGTVIPMRSARFAADVKRRSEHADHRNAHREAPGSTPGSKVLLWMTAS